MARIGPEHAKIAARLQNELGSQRFASAGLSAEPAPTGITVNIVSPGYIEDTDFFQGKLTDERRAQLIAATHDKRPGRPDNVAGLIEPLTSPPARHITGQTVHLNGGAYTTR